METKYLGSLDLMKYFIHEGNKYRTITYPPSSINQTTGTRWCLNMKTLKAEFIFCREKVEPVEEATSETS